MERKKLIIFDFDGVIIDSWEHAYKGNLHDWPDLKPEEHKNFFKGNVFEEIKKMPPSARTKEDRDAWLEREYYPTKKKLSVFEGIQEVVKNLASNFTLVINTSAPEKSTREYLERARMDSYFDKIYGTEISKNKKEKFEQILKDYNVNPEECLCITDTVGDVVEAKHCNIKSLVVTYGYQSRDYFNSIEDEVIGFAEKPSDILNFFR